MIRTCSRECCQSTACTLPVVQLFSLDVNDVGHIDYGWLLGSLTPLDHKCSTLWTTGIFSSIANTGRCELSDVLVLRVDL